MIVKELIEELQKLRQDALVLVTGWCGNGSDEVDFVLAFDVIKKPSPKDCEGEYDSQWENVMKSNEKISAVRIGARRGE